MDQDNKNNNEGNEGIDLNDKLKDSDTGVKFQDERQQPAQTLSPGTSKIIQWMINHSGGLIKDEKQANYVLIGFVVVAVVVLLFLIFGGGESTGFRVPPLQNPPMPL